MSDNIQKATLDFLTNATMSRQALLSHLTEGAKDINSECGYPDTITTSDYQAMYDREGIATRVVEVLPQESWATDPKITENADAQETAFEKQFVTLNKEKRLFHYLARADEQSGIGSYGILLLGIDDGLELNVPVASVVNWERPEADNSPDEENIDDDKPIEKKESPTNKPGEKPLSTKQQRRDDKQNNPPDPEPEPEEVVVPEQETELLYLRVFAQSLVEVVAFEKDVTNPRFGQPVMYTITFADDSDHQGQVGSADSTKKKVHWTRVIHFADNRKSSEVFGTPRQRPVFNRLTDLRKLLGGSAEMFWKGAFPGYSFEVDGDAADIEIDADSMREEFERYSNGLQRYLALAGVSAKSLAPQVASPEAHVKAELEAIAITLGVPVRIFTGSEAAHLASTTDETTWNKRVARRRENYVSPYIVRPLIDRLMAMKVLMEIAEYDVDWDDLNLPSEADKAIVVDKITNALAKYVGGSVDQIIPPREYLVGIVGMDSDEVDEILEAAEDLVAEQDLEAEEEAAVMAEQAAAFGMEASDITKDAGASFSQPPPVPVVVPAPKVKKA